MRTGDKAGFFEISHHVADRRRRQVEAGKTRKRSRANGLAVGDVMFDEGLQKGAGAVIKHGKALYKNPEAALLAIFMQEFSP
jgi:hypothetical protein